MNIPIAQSARIAAELRECLADEYGLDPDDEAIDDTVSGEVDLPEQIARIMRDAIKTEAFAEGLAALIKEQQARKARLEAKAAKARALVSWALQESGFKKLALPDMTLTITPGKRPVIVDEGAELPDAYTRIKREPDKIAIRAALEAETELSFARFGNASPTLTVRKG